MEDTNEGKFQQFLDKFTTEAEKTVKLLEKMRTKAINLVHKGERIPNTELKQNVRKQALTELEELIEKLVSLNIELELDFVECPNFTIPYFTPGEDTVHKLKFLSGDNPWNFWLIDNNIDCKGILKNLLQKYQIGLLDPITNPRAAQSVCFIDRNKVIRGIILQIKNENRVKLVDCDSNVTKVVTSDKLYNIDADTCHVHASALRCTISEEPDAIELWKNSDLRDMFCNTLREATLFVKIVKRVAGSFPMFVVDIQLKIEDEDSTASLKDWILGRLLPELKKLGIAENEPVCDYLSEESLSPYYKSVVNNEMAHPINMGPDQVGENRSLEQVEEKPSPKQVKENRSPDQVKEAVAIQNEVLNNLDYPSDKLSEKLVSNLDHIKEINNSSEQIENKLENDVSKATEEKIISTSATGDSVTSSKELLVSNISQQTEPVTSSLNGESSEFHSKPKRPDIPRFSRKHQNNRNPYHHQTHATFGPLGFVPNYQPWAFAGQPLAQTGPVGNNMWSYNRPPTWSPGPNLAICPVNTASLQIPNANLKHEVNILAPEFVPKNSITLQMPEAKKVELPSEHITLRRSTTLIEENQNLLVLPSYVETPSEFYVNFVNQSNKYLDKLLNDMFSYYSTREKIVFDSWREAKSKMGKFCACKWSEDENWFRVEVLDWTAGVNLVKVRFVDYGNTNCVPLTDLQPLTKMFEKLTICSQACHLAKVYPLKKGEPWSEEAIEFFKSKVNVSRGPLYSITVVPSNTKAMKQNSFSVLLYEGKAEEGSKSINDLMVEQRLAWSKELLTEVAESSSPISSENYYSTEDLSDKQSNTDSGEPKTVGLTNETPSLPLQLQHKFENGVELDNDFERWNPLKEDYESVLNNPMLDTDDACVAVSGYSARDEARICKFYASNGFCFKAVCYKEHSMPNPDGITTDKEEVYVSAFSQLELPKPGEVVRLRITCVFSINLFYAQIEETKGVALDDEFKEEAETLTSLEEYMNRSENVHQMSFLTIAPSPGELVLARERNEETGSEWWYRARVISLDDNPADDNPEIMFVDYGTTCSVSITDLRKMEKRYLHLPFQAIECSMANIEMLETEHEKVVRGTELLQEVLLGEVLTAKIYASEDITNDVVRLQVLLQLKNGKDVGQLLVEKNICQPRLLQIDAFPYS